MNLPHRDFELLQRTLLDLYEYRELEEFRRALPRILLKLISADHFCLATYDLDPATHSAKLIDCLESEPRVRPEVVPHWEARIWEHPFTRYFINGGRMTALMISDFLTNGQLRKSELWETLCKVLEYDRNITLPVASDRGTSAISFGRRGKDFTERDRLLLNLIRPHFDQAYRNAQMVTARHHANGQPLAGYGLRPREAEIAHWLARGKTNPEIALILEISPRTVEKHLERILERLQVENRTAAAVLISQATAATPLPEHANGAPRL